MPPKRGTKQKPKTHTRKGWLRAGETATILTPELHRELVKAIAGGDFRNAAALRCGVHPTTLRNWLRSGLQEGAPAPFAAFAIEFLQAEMKLRQEKLDVLLDPFVSRAQVAALTWYMDRRFQMWRGKDYDPGPDGAEAIDVLGQAEGGSSQLTAANAAALIPRLIAHPQIRAMLEAAGCTLPPAKETALVQQAKASDSSHAK